MLCYLLLLSSVSCINDLQILNDLYKSTHGENWNRNDNWQNNDPCTRFGVVCQDNRVITLSMQGNNMVGPLPKNFGYLTKLQSFDFSGNKISGSFPESIVNMKELSAMFDLNYYLSCLFITILLLVGCVKTKWTVLSQMFSVKLPN